MFLVGRVLIGHRIGVSFSLRRSFDPYLLPSMASESSRIGLFTNAEVTTSGRPVLRSNEVECFLLSSVDLDFEDDPPRFTSLRSSQFEPKSLIASFISHFKQSLLIALRGSI
ncbi:hypothetical protein DY000_02049220 [Brassica cretica]|uniref:Uncharacterized protein n=1 Tax=Brassica cretica TaxID=69181 RepID=A0ABQ7EWZ7_BRACR|nr:hypothetical protein DY000_02049220 [Brassica cretica]